MVSCLGTGMVLLKSCLQTCMTYTIAECIVNKLLMMDRGTVRNMSSFMPEYICEISASRWFYYKEICCDARSHKCKIYWSYYVGQFCPLPTMCHTVCKLYIITKALCVYVKWMVVWESYMLCLKIWNWSAIAPSCGPRSYVLVKSDQFCKKWSDLIINWRKYM
jgi:hypothetical protein